MDIYDQALDAIEIVVEAAIKAAGHKRVRVCYSAYESKDDVPINNLDQVAIAGKVVLVSSRSTFFGERAQQAPVSQA